MNKRMFKSTFAICLVLVMLFCAFSCAPKAKTVFKNQSYDFFESFKTEQTAGKRRKQVEYGKNGSVAISYPETGEKQLDKKVKEYCDSKKQSFSETAQNGDALYIGYSSYSPAAGIYGIEMVCKSIIAGVESESRETFNYDKNTDGGSAIDADLDRLIMINAKTDIAGRDGVDADKLKTAKPSSKLFKANCVQVTYAAGDVSAHEQTVEVPYTKLRPLLPESLKQKTPDTERVVDISKKMVALTYDDGPHNTYTNKILDTLEKHGAVATFFEVGTLLSQGADTLKRAKSLGCELASHTWSHANLQKSSLEEIKSQIEKVDKKFIEILGEAPTLLRPPYGAVGKTLLQNTDKYLIGWSVDTEDWRYRDADKIISTVKNAGDLDGQVILMHSLYESTAKATEKLVPWLIEQGYEIVTVSELIKYKYEDVLQTGKYYTYNYFDK